MHSAEIVHRDLKPRNIFISDTHELKIGDLGHAKFFPDDRMRNFGLVDEYVSTRPYRSPEVLIGVAGVPKALDMWAVGCILAEMILGRTLFNGKDRISQLEMILRIIGYPSQEAKEQVVKTKSGWAVMNQVRKLPANALGSLCQWPAHCLDLLKKLFAFDSRERITVDEAIAHPFLAAFHDAADEPTTKPLSGFDFTFDAQRFTNVEF
jgi:mitogen-activated protein kinase 7